MTFQVRQSGIKPVIERGPCLGRNRVEIQWIAGDRDFHYPSAGLIAAAEPAGAMSLMPLPSNGDRRRHDLLSVGHGAGASVPGAE